MLGAKYNFYVVLFMFVLMLSGFYFFYDFVGGLSLFIVWQVFDTNFLSLEFPILLDKYALDFLLTVMIIFSSVLMFSYSYMSAEKFGLRFHLILTSFVVSMFLLILVPNVFGMFLGWDGLGVSSYFLVIYFQKEESLNSGMLTLLTNRVGDVVFMIILSILCLESSYLWFPLSFMDYSFFLFSPGWLLVVAAITKSAQIPFSAWLPAAMAAPTPVSALVHSSTLVTAGIYIMFRFSVYQLSLVHSFSWFLLFVGGFTMIMAGCSAMAEMDAKKIVALSTLSQLGLMSLTLSLGNYEIAFVHLICHAYFKALLFISVGSLIHLSGGYQDLRKFSSLINCAPISLMVAFISSLSLCGIFFLAGFYSKDLCIESLYDPVWNLSLSGMSRYFFFLCSKNNLFVWVFYYLGVLLTVLYSFRFVYYLSFNSLSSGVLKMYDLDTSIIISQIFLLFLSVGGGSLMMWFYFCPGSFVFFLPSYLKLIPVFLLFFSVFFCFKYLSFKSLNLIQNKFMQNFMFMWSLPLVSGSWMSWMGANLSGSVNESLEKNYMKMFFCWGSISNSISVYVMDFPKFSIFKSFFFFFLIIFFLCLF